MGGEDWTGRSGDEDGYGVLVCIACCPVVVVVVVVGVETGGRARDAVDDSTGVAIEEESAGEESVAAAAAPNPNPNRARGGREASFSFSFSFAGANDCCFGTGTGNTRARFTMDVIGLIGTWLGVLVCAALAPFTTAGRKAFTCLGAGAGDGIRVAVPEPEPALA